jgi:hypothetical protein
MLNLIASPTVCDAAVEPSNPRSDVPAIVIVFVDTSTDEYLMRSFLMVKTPVGGISLMDSRTVMANPLDVIDAASVFK